MQHNAFIEALEKNSTIIEYPKSDGCYDFSYQGCDLCNHKAGKTLGNDVARVRVWLSLEALQDDETRNAYEADICAEHICTLANGE